MQGGSVILQNVWNCSLDTATLPRGMEPSTAVLEGILILQILVPWGRLLLQKLKSHAASQETLRLLSNAEVRDHVHKSLPLVCILCQMNPTHIFTPLFFNIHF